MNKKIRVLIVDDSKGLRQIIMRYIKDLNDIEFFEAGNGEEAEQILQEQALKEMPIKIVVLDWVMPKVTGFEFLKKIRSVQIFEKDPRVIMLSAETYSDLVNACMKYGVEKYVTKPFTQEQLAEAFESTLKKVKVASGF